MSALAAVVRPLGGVVRLLSGDRSGLALVGADSRAGWIASFVVPGLLILPAYLYLSFPSLGDDDDFGAVLLVEAIGYVVGLVAFPVAAHLLCAQWNKTEEWFDFVPAYNWAGVLQMAIYTPAAALGQSDALAPGALLMLGALAMAAAVAVQYRIGRTVLGIDALQAFGLVALEFSLGIVLRQVVDRLHGF